MELEETAWKYVLLCDFDEIPAATSDYTEIHETELDINRRIRKSACRIRSCMFRLEHPPAEMRRHRERSNEHDTTLLMSKSFNEPYHIFRETNRFREQVCEVKFDLSNRSKLPF